ncbi:kinase-like domain-containing protein [Rhizophagus irregularis DAOM 181602=DAOM 197198]|nr:kinase-like domain-containing protein [Rhizophagus irregularis DAOM 181602=DAOM 197198]
MDKENDKDIVVNEINILNSEVSDNLINEDFDLEIYKQHVLSQEYGLCIECNQQNTFEDWCKDCCSKKFQQNFGNWTSENAYIDKFIQESQLNASDSFELLEWIPYNKLRNIQFLAQGGFSTIFKAIRLDGWINKWDYEKHDWDRIIEELGEQDYEDSINPKTKNPLKINEKYGLPVVLKSLNDSSNINDNFLNEWKLHLQCQYRAALYGSVLAPLMGITQDPDTFNYMIVMMKMESSLRTQLEAIHKLNLVHGDLHNGNILCNGFNSVNISDLGLCRPVNQPHINNNIYGVLPYMAPEVLRGKPYTKAADIYSFGMIMWEMTSGIPVFHNVPHDLNLSLNICRGIRPEIIEGMMPEYVELMKRCWDNDPEKRPTAEELEQFFFEWDRKYPTEENKEKRISIPENEPEITYHPKTYYKSRKIDYSAKINEILQSETLADCIITEEEAAAQEFSDYEEN